MGRVLLYLLRANNIEQRALFVVHNTATQKIGPIHFQMLQEVATKAMEKGPFNMYTNTRQVISAMQKPKETPSVSLNSSVDVSDNLGSREL